MQKILKIAIAVAVLTVVYLLFALLQPTVAKEVTTPESTPATTPTTTASKPIDNSADTIYITTKEQFIRLISEVNNGDNKEGVQYIMQSNITLDSLDFAVVGGDNMMFCGDFDGGGHEVMWVCDTIPIDFQGLFVCIGEVGVVRNLAVSNKVNVSYMGGGIAGVNKGEMLNYKSNVNGASGGIAGVNGHDGLIVNCYNTGSVSEGGIAGSNMGRIDNCYNTAKIEGQEEVGGIAGSNHMGIITNCLNIGRVSAKGRDAGAITGFNYEGDVINCYSLAGCARSNGRVYHNGFQRSAKELKSRRFIDKLNANAGDYNDPSMEGASACVWTSGPGGFPVLDFSVTATAQGFKKGSGTKDEPYIIDSKGQLKLLSRKLVMGYETHGLHFKMTGDINLKCTANDQWIPIGSSVYNTENVCANPYVFRGEFDGGGHKIRGLYINTKQECQGLFGVIGYGGVVKDIRVEGKVSGVDYVGGIAGLNYGTITGCRNAATISGESLVGGIAGACFEFSSTTVEVSNCSNTGKIHGIQNVGGITGKNQGTTANCYSLKGCVTPAGEYSCNGTIMTAKELKSNGL